MKKYPYYTVINVVNNNYIVAGWDYKSDSQDFINDTLETVKADGRQVLKRFLKTYSKKYVMNNLNMNPAHRSHPANLDEFILLPEVDFNGNKGTVMLKSLFNGII